MRALLLLPALLLLARVALADPATGDRLAAQAQQQYAAGHYLDAAATFTSAYAQDPKPAYLFNIAQAYRFGNACAPAAAYYRKFVDAVRDAPNLDKVRRYITEMDACASAGTAGTPGSAGERSTTPPPPAPTDASTAAAPASSRDDADLPDPGRTKRYTGIAVGVVGIAALIVGVHYQQVVNDTENQQNALNATCTAMPAPQNADCSGTAFRTLEDRGHRASTLAITSYGVGAAAIAGGIALYFLGRSETAGYAAVHTLVSTTPGGAMLGASFRF